MIFLGITPWLWLWFGCGWWCWKWSYLVYQPKLRELWSGGCIWEPLAGCEIRGARVEEMGWNSLVISNILDGNAQRSKVKMMQIFFKEKKSGTSQILEGLHWGRILTSCKPFGIDIRYGTHYRNEVFIWTTHMHNFPWTTYTHTWIWEYFSCTTSMNMMIFSCTTCT